jgi:hypothetical protein
MSTKSIIARKTTAGYECIYCHWDGYPSHHAPILKAGYATDAKVAELMNLGDLCILGPEIGHKHDGDEHAKNPSATNMCLAYGRDSNDHNSEKRIYETELEAIEEAEKSCADYVYLFQDGAWMYKSLYGEDDWDELPDE